jgi:hypothetical protein
MVDEHLVHAVVLLVILWLCMTWYWVRQRSQSTTCQTTPTPAQPTQKRSRNPKPFPGLTHKPHCAACEGGGQVPTTILPADPPSLLVSTRGCPRTVDTQRQFCPSPRCDYYGWTGLGNLRANGHPSGGPWRQLHCVACGAYFLETHGTPLHGTRVAPEQLVWAVGALAEGLGIRAVARVFEVDPHTVLVWLIEVAGHAAAFSRHFLHDVHVSQIQLDELFTLLSTVKADEVSEVEAVERLSRSPHWVWAAIDPVTKLLLTIDVGERTLAMAQGVVHHMAQVLAPGCVPLFLMDGFKAYMTALLTHFGQWVQLPRRRAQGPTPKSRWMPLPQLLYAQVVKQYRRRRVVRVHHRVVFGTPGAVQQVLAAHGWQINTAFIERINLTIRYSDPTK